MSEENSTSWNGTAAAALTRLLTIDPDSARELAALEGRTINIVLSSTEREVCVRVSHGRLNFIEADDATAIDVKMSGRPADFLALVRANRQGESIAAGRIEITGDLAIAQQVQNFMLNLDIDYEELLSQYVGDVAAHQIGRFADTLLRGAQSSLERFERDLFEFVHHESRTVVSNEEAESFKSAVYSLNDDVERVAVRLNRLRKTTR